MGFEYISILPTPDEIKEQFPWPGAGGTESKERPGDPRRIYGKQRQVPGDRGPLLRGPRGLGL